MFSESEMRMSHCCFTGHRPEKLKRTESEICADLESEIRIAINKGFQVFITGMARGTDIWAGEIVLKLRCEGFPVKLICASPFPGLRGLGRTIGNSDTGSYPMRRIKFNLLRPPIVLRVSGCETNGWSIIPPL